MKPRSKQTVYHNIPVNYRFENRKKGLAISFALYDWLDSKTTSPPICEKIISVPKKLYNHSEEEMISACLPKFFIRAFPSPTAEKKISEEEADRRSRYFIFLPIAIVATCNTDAVLSFNSWEKSTGDEYKRAIAWIAENLGDLPLKDLSPKAVAEKLPHSSFRKAASIVRALRSLFSYEMSLKTVATNPWVDYKVNDHVGKRKISVSAGLSSIQMKALSEKAFDLIIRNTLSCAPNDPYYFALTLYLITPLNAEEICALEWEDFCILNEYRNCLVVRVHKEYCKDHQNKYYHLVDISNPYRRRVIPLPAILKTVYENIGFPHSLGPVLRHPSNKARRCPVDCFLNWIRKNVGTYPDHINFSDLSDSRLEALFKSSLQYHYHNCGFEEDELLYLMGKKPQSTAGKHYCDFCAEGELNRLSLLQDRWISFSPLSMSEAKEDKISFSVKGDRYTVFAKPGSLIQVKAHLIIVPVKQDLIPRPIKIRLYSTRGHSTKVSLSNKENHNEP